MSKIENGFSPHPYPGLRPYYREEADIFFGREEQVDELLAKLQDSRFLAIIGPSGSGKSSLIRAGMIPGLEAGFMVRAGVRWCVALLQPGMHPMRSLVEALVQLPKIRQSASSVDDISAHVEEMLRRGPLGLVEVLRETPLPDGTNLVLLVDQFEEIFRFEQFGDADEAEAFVSLLLASARQTEAPIYVSLAMRSDFVGDCAALPGLPDALNHGLFLIPQLSREHCRAAIEGPAAVFGAEVEPVLVNRILNDLGTNPDQLPILQHALLRMWFLARARQDAGANHVKITTEDYVATGALSDALARHVESVFNGLSTSHKRIAEIAFRSLTEITTDGQIVRRAASIREICEAADVDEREVGLVIDVFRANGRSFLAPPMPAPLCIDSFVDISHGSLIRQWPRLLQWTEDESRARQLQRRLSEEARVWAASGKDHGYLYTGLRLQEAVQWLHANSHSASVDGMTRQFIEESMRRTGHQIRSRLTLGWAFIATAVAAVCIYLLATSQ